jgi:peptidoglycan hydrolase-like protein with peptidoglycan-binding domain
MTASAAPAKKPRGASKKSAAGKTSAKKRASAKPSAVSVKSSKRPAKRRTTTARRRARRPAGQARPAPERLAEIQRALKQRGYYQGEADGKWDDASTSALKRFQADQNLRQDGKIGSLSLIALGLGPKRGGASAQPPVQVSTPSSELPAEAPPIPVPNDKVPE